LITKSRGLIIWLALLIISVVISSSPWGLVTLTPAAGGQLVSVSGSQSFPVLSAIFGIQFALIFVCLFFDNLMMRILRGVLGGANVWLAIWLYLTGESQIRNALSFAIEKLTGISGGEAHTDIISSTRIEPTYFWQSLILLVLGVVLFVIAGAPTHERRAGTKVTKDVEKTKIDNSQLWDEQ
jgi:hypothetical protein